VNSTYLFQLSVLPERSITARLAAIGPLPVDPAVVMIAVGVRVVVAASPPTG